VENSSNKPLKTTDVLRVKDDQNSRDSSPFNTSPDKKSQLTD